MKKRLECCLRGEMSEITNKELKIIKEDYRSKVFFFIAIFGTIILFAFIYTVLAEIPRKGMLPITIISFVVCFTIVYVLTKKHRLDLKYKNAISEIVIVKDKKYKMDYEPGSASINPSIISILFFKNTVRVEMKEMPLYLITVNDEKYFVEKDLFNKMEKGDNVIFRTSEYTKLFLGFELIS